jgi:hypothetical protein
VAGPFSPLNRLPAERTTNSWKVRRTPLQGAYLGSKAQAVSENRSKVDFDQYFQTATFARLFKYWKEKN